MRESWIVLLPRQQQQKKNRVHNLNVKQNTFLEHFLEPTRGGSFRLNNITEYVVVAAEQMKIIEG